MLKKYVVSSIALGSMLFMMLGTTVLAGGVPNTADEEPVTQARVTQQLKEGSVVAFFSRYWIPVDEKVPDGYYRKFIAMEEGDLFLIQDFFTETGRKQSDPVLVSNQYEVKNAGFLKTIKGPYVTWYQNGQKQSQALYKPTGVLDGDFQTWYSNGTLKIKGSYVNGKKSGNWSEWYENGQLKLQAIYDKGQLNGAFSRWFENGQQQAVGIYNRGLLNGLWIVWNSKGEKISEGEYVSSKRENLWTYYTAGKKWAEGSYVDNLQDGTWTYWDGEGNKLKSVFYQKGIPVGEEMF